MHLDEVKIAIIKNKKLRIVYRKDQVIRTRK